MTSVHDMLGDDKLSVYEAGKIIEAAGKAMREAGSAWSMLKDEQKAELDRLVTQISSVLRKTKPALMEIDKAVGSHLDKLSSHEQAVRRANAKLLKQVQAASSWELGASLGNIRELLSLVEQLNSIPPERLERLVEVARIFQDRGEKL